MNTSTIVSFRKIAESVPETKTINANRRRGVRAKRMTCELTRWKKPAIRRFTFSTIIPKSSRIVFQSTARYAASSGMSPQATKSTAPTRAIVARFIFSAG
ncbi:MAG TPA: hypothetical protein VK178_05405 [Opitutaceae bacterium]|nr:hypothetical protein [Opitutaceae bacterium]